MPGRAPSSSKYCKLANNPRLRQAVAGKLRFGLVARADSRLAEEKPILKTGVIRCHTRTILPQSICFKPVACSRKSCFVIFDRSARCVAPGRLIRMAIDGGIIKDIVSIRQRPAAV